MRDLSYKILLDEFFERIRYISGKRETETAGYFRYTACEADAPMIKRLFAEAAELIISRCGTERFRYEIGEEGFSFDWSFSSDETRSGQFSRLFCLALVHYAIYWWLLLTGFADCQPWKVKAEDYMDRLISLFSGPNKPFCRPMHP